MKQILFTNLSNGNYLLTINGVAYQLINVKAGTFQMGEWGGCHPETIISDFLIGEIPVTNELFNTVMDEDTALGNKKPAVNKTLDEFLEFIEKLNQITHLQFRLPTEKEWEYAAKGGHKSRGFKFSGSDKLSDVAFFHDMEGPTKLQEVKQFKPNELGLYDMTGNICEITSDVTETGDSIIKGGSWYNLNTKRFDPGITWTSNSVKDRGVGIRLVLQ